MIWLRAWTFSRTSSARRLRVDEIADADATAADLVLVGRADAPRRRADLALPAAGLAEDVELAVIRQDEVRLLADQEAIADLDAERAQLVDLREQRLWIDDDTVADDAQHAVVEDAGRNQMEHELLAVDVNGMAGVVAALIAGHHAEMWREQVDDLALAFVPPLRAQNRDVHAHYCILRP